MRLPFFSHPPSIAALAVALALDLAWPLLGPVRSAEADGITSPGPGSTVSGLVDVRGTAGSAGSSFRSYRLEFGAGRAPAGWRPIGPERDHTVERGVLGRWETDGLPPGEYSLRLTVFDEAGHETESRVVVTVIATAAPTVTGTPTARPRPTPPASPTITPEPTPTAVAEPAEPGPTPSVAEEAAAEPAPVAEPGEGRSPEPTPQPSPSGSGGPEPQPPTGSAFRCPMLYYHEVPHQAGLAAQLAAFLEAGYRPVSMGRLVEALEGRAEPPPGCLVLTFDDGLASQLSGALPVLRRFAVPATFFVMPAFRDGVHRYMTPRDFRALRAAGFEIGSHTLNHASLPPLLRLDPGAFQAEIVHSKAMLEQETGQPIDLLAYPNGAWDHATAAELREAGYRAAASTMPGGWQRPEDLFWLRRIRADPWEPPSTVLARLRG